MTRRDVPRPTFGTGTTIGLSLDGRGVVRCETAPEVDATAQTPGQTRALHGAIPGDHVRWTEIAPTKAKQAKNTHSVALEITQPSPHRVAPECPVQQTCGGCPLMVMEPRAAFAAKVDAVLRAMGDVIDAPTALAMRNESRFSAQYRYRTRARLAFADRRLGYHVASSARLQPLSACIILDPRLQQALEVLADTLVPLLRDQGEILLQTSFSGEGCVVGIRTKVQQSPDLYRVAQSLCESGKIAGIRLWIEGSAQHFGALEGFRDGDGHTLLCGPDGFYQGNEAENRRLVEYVLTLLEPQAGVECLELYAGAGNFTLPLLRRGVKATAIESAPTSIAALRNNLSRENLTCAVVAVDSETYMASNPKRLDRVLLDPPRTGAKGIVPLAFAQRAKRIVYVSCDAATLARDLRDANFQSAGYSLDRVRCFDMFPNTAHVETVVRLTRNT